MCTVITFVHLYPMKKEAEVLMAIQNFAKEVGAPRSMICDPSRAQTKQDVKTFCANMDTTLRILEKNTPWANKAELYI